MIDGSETKDFSIRVTDKPNTKYPVSEPLSEQGMLNSWDEIDEMKQMCKSKIRHDKNILSESAKLQKSDKAN